MRLIDADELKKVIDKYCEDYQGFDGVIDIIDNAPTVEYTFEEAFQKTVCEQKLYCPKRPQGEWIKVKENRMSIDMSGEIVTGYKCSKCGRFITILPSKLADYPFCHCGADMRGKNNDK